jgi:MFS family permease
LNTFYSLYATSYLGWDESNAAIALMVAPATMVLTAILTGKLAERIGRKRTIFIGLVGLSISLGVLMFIRTDSLLVLASVFGVIGVFYGMININTIVIIWELAPKDKVGSYTGSYYFFSQLSDTLTPMVAGGVFSLYLALTSAAAGQQYALLMPYGIVCEILAMIFLFRVKRGESEEYYQRKGK